jgi:hypothetical protein
MLTYSVPASTFVMAARRDIITIHIAVEALARHTEPRCSIGLCGLFFSSRIGEHEEESSKMLFQYEIHLTLFPIRHINYSFPFAKLKPQSSCASYVHATINPSVRNLSCDPLLFLHRNGEVFKQLLNPPQPAVYRRPDFIAVARLIHERLVRYVITVSFLPIVQLLTRLECPICSLPKSKRNVTDNGEWNQKVYAHAPGVF